MDSRISFTYLDKSWLFFLLKILYGNQNRLLIIELLYAKGQIQNMFKPCYLFCYRNWNLFKREIEKDYLN